VAAVGAVVLARRRRGTTLDDDERDPAHWITPRSLFSGTMAEAVGAIRDPGAEPVATPAGHDEEGGW